MRSVRGFCFGELLSCDDEPCGQFVNVCFDFGGLWAVVVALSVDEFMGERANALCVA